MIKEIKYFIGKNLTFSQLKNRTLLKKEALKLHGKILDLGCGNGEYSFLMARNKENSITAVDSNSELCKRIENGIEKYNIKNIEVVETDGSKLPFPDNSFDACFCNTVLEHVKDPIKIIAEINRVVKKNGQVVISIPFLQEIHADPFDFQRYTPFGLKNVLEQQGFLVEKIYNDYGALNTLEYLLCGSLIWRLRLSFWKNFPLGYLYALILALFFIVTKIFHIIFYRFQKQDKHFITQVTIVAKKRLKEMNCWSKILKISR